jgi:hypothetical protein
MDSKSEAVIAIHWSSDWAGKNMGSLKVRIDGNKVGKIKFGPGPVEFSVKPGVHTVVVSRDMMRSRSLKVAIEAGSRVVLIINPMLSWNRFLLKSGLVSLVFTLAIPCFIFTYFKSPGWSLWEWACLWFPVSIVGICAYIFLTPLLFGDYWVFWELNPDYS